MRRKMTSVKVIDHETGAMVRQQVRRSTTTRQQRVIDRYVRYCRAHGYLVAVRVWSPEVCEY